MLHRIMHFVLALTAILIPFTEASSEESPDLAITYTFSGGRFGDNLLAMSHAAWLSYSLGIPLVYNPFPSSDKLTLHTDPTIKKREEVANYQKKILRDENDYLEFFKLLHAHGRTAKTLYEIPFFPEIIQEYDLHPSWFSLYLQVNWEDPGYVSLLRKYIAPLKPIKKLKLPEDRITVALHVRQGGDFDPIGWHLSSPLKGPPDAYYFDSINYLSKVVNKPLYIFIFTDYKKPLEIKEKFSQAFKCKDIVFDCQQETIPDYIDDFFAMKDFDCLIRTGSNYSAIASRIFPFKIVVSPLREKIINSNELMIDQILFEIRLSETLKQPLKVIFRK